VLIFDPRNKNKFSGAAGARDSSGRKLLAINTLEMQLPYLWLRGGHSDTTLHKLGLADKTALLPEDEFLQVRSAKSKRIGKTLMCLRCCAAALMTWYVCDVIAPRTWTNGRKITHNQSTQRRTRSASPMYC
jgi:hypothetical protein